MIIVKLQGGLGNQLFQYAAARRLSLLHRTELKFDLSWFAEHSEQRYALGACCVHEAFATPEEIAQLKGTARKGINRLVVRATQKLRPYYMRSVFAEPHLRPFDENILRTPPNLYLEGYWQSEKYFTTISDVIRTEFSFRLPPDERNRAVADRISATESVSVHLRRGDYISDKYAEREHGICGLDYYIKSVEFITKWTKHPHFYIFSDDPSWARQNLSFDSPVDFVDHNVPEKGFEDLRLMILCKHNIIANSSFSWWGAWLNTNAQKIVIAPNQWFKDRALDTRDLLPSAWVRL